MSSPKLIDPNHGIEMLNPTKVGGRTWYSNWHTATSHNWTSAGTDQSNRDAQDNLVDLHCPTGNKATVDQTTDTMIAGVEGAASNAWRLYVNDPAGVWKWQPSVEMTVYYKAIAEYSGGTVKVHSRLASATEHQLEFSCSASGHGYSFEIKNNKTIQIRKEIAHPFYVDNVVSAIADAPLNVWIGMKFVVKVQGNGDVLLQCYRDMTDGVDGGTWDLVVERLDKGDMLMSNDADVDGFNAVNSGSGNCAKISSRTARLNFPASSCYLRMDNFQVHYKKFSIREIDPTGVAPPIQTSNMGLFHSGGATNADPLFDIGGLKSSQGVKDSQLDGVLNSLTKAELDSGLADYRLHYLVNLHPTLTLRGVKAYVFSDTQSLDDQILIGKATEAKNTTVNPVANRFTAPAGVSFSASTSPSNPLNYGDLLPSDYVGLWYKRAVNQGAKELPNNLGLVAVVWDSEGTSGGGTPPPDPDTGIVEKASFMADCSCSSDFKNSLNKLKARNPGICFWAGDLAYKSGSQCWITELENANVDTKSFIAFGNHDVDESESQPETRNNLRTKFRLTKNYYTFTFQNIFCLVLDSEANPESGSQVTELKPKLEAAANNPAIEWIFVMHHRPIYGPTGSTHPNETDVRDTWDPIFDANRVDLVITGHNHIAWQSNLIKYNSGSPSNPTVLQSGTAFSYNRGQSNHGKIYIGVGNGGRSHYSASGTPSYVPWSNDNDYGYCFGEFSNLGKRLKLTWYKYNDTILRSITIDHIQ